MKRLKNKIQKFADGVADRAARPAAAQAAKEASRDMIYELIAQLQSIGKDQEAIAIIDKLGEVYFGYARLEWNGVLHIPYEHFVSLSTVRYEKAQNGLNTYTAKDLSNDEILADLGRNGFEVVAAHPAGTGFDYFLKKRLYSRPRAIR